MAGSRAQLPFAMTRSLAFVILCAVLAPTCSPTPSPPSGPPIANGLALRVVAQGLQDPLYLTAPASDPRLFVVEQPGRIRIVREGRLLAAPFLDITRRVGYGGERGLLGMAFHPRYAHNGFFYVNYTDRNGDTRIERYQVSERLDVADPATGKLVLVVPQPYANHNGGMVTFGPDGMLYIGMGDGGSGGDPHGNGQDRGTLLGALLRIDVDRGDPYAIPPDNPFVGRRDARPEIWAWGLRNPWRFCFDPVTHRLYIADVGQGRWEEVDVVDSREPGLNFGWNLMEGAHCFRSPGCDQHGLVLPRVEYGHPQGCSVTGGFVYRGAGMAELQGHYFYADYCAGWIRSFSLDHEQVTQHRQWNVGNIGSVMSFGEDASGELYVLSASGRVYRMTLDRWS